MAKILVVDDETDLEVLIKQKFREKIREKNYEFYFATNGKQALELVKLHPDLDVILSDINMPEMDGLTLLSKLNEQNILSKTVIVSAYGDLINIRIAMNRGAFDFVTKPVNFKDLEITIEKTIQHVKQIRETLQSVKENNILRMYVDETVLNFMGSREFESSLLVNETIDATVAFIDICGFTSISETQPPDKVVKLLNAYFDIMVKEVIHEKGIIDKFIGDGIMAVFKGPYHLDRAIDACIKIRNILNEQSNVLIDMTFKPYVSIGINSGEMISGNIGSSTLKRLDYTVIGDTVNVAARLQSAAKLGQILINEINYFKVKESFACKLIGPIDVKNKESTIMAYEVIN